MLVQPLHFSGVPLHLFGVPLHFMEFIQDPAPALYHDPSSFWNIHTLLIGPWLQLGTGE